MDNLFGFDVALKYLKEGKAVRRRYCFDDGCSISLIQGRIEANPPWMFSEGYVLDTDDILAEDWEVVECEKG